MTRKCWRPARASGWCVSTSAHRCLLAHAGEEDSGDGRAALARHLPARLRLWRAAGRECASAMVRHALGQEPDPYPVVQDAQGGTARTDERNA